MAKQKKDYSFEENIQRIEEIIDTLNNDTLPLQQAVTLHAEASLLIKESEGLLQKATLQFETLEW